MSKLTNLFEDFRHYQWRKVDSPYYEPLGQTILASEGAKEEQKKQKHNEHQKSFYEKNKEKIKEYHKNYYEKNKERLKEYNRNYWRKRHESSNPKGELSWLQKKVYDYLLNQYRKWEEPARWTQIAKALWISENSVYTAAFQLTKKWYLGRGTYGKYLLTKFPDGEESKEDNESLENNIKETEEVTSKKSRKHIDWEDYSPWYVSYLKSSIKTGQKIISELKERVVYLEEQLEKVQVVEVNEENKSDYLKKLEGQNTKLADEVIMLRKIVKYLSRYID